MIEYRMNGAAMILSDESSRAAGHLQEFSGTVDGSRAAAVRAEIRRDAVVLASSLGRAVEVYATHPSVQDWLVDTVEPEAVQS